MLHNKLLRVIQAHLVGFSTNIVLSCKRFCLFCLFRTSLSFAGCLVQLVYTYFPNRVINRPLRVSWLFFKTHNRRWPRSIDTRSTLRGPLPTPDVAEGPTTWPDYFVNVHIIHRCIIGR